MFENNVRVWSFRGLLKGNLLAFSLLFLGAHASLAQVATADLPGNPTPVGGVGTQEIPEADVEDFDIPVTSKPTCNPSLKTGEKVELTETAESLTCTGPGEETVSSITGPNGQSNSIILEGGANLTVTGDVALDKDIVSGVSGGTINKGNTIKIQEMVCRDPKNCSSLNINGNLSFHQNDGKGNPDSISNAGTLNVGGSVDLYQYEDTFTNSGTVNITENIGLGSGDDKLLNSGSLTIGGDLNTKLGDDLVDNSGSLTVNGNLQEAERGKDHSGSCPGNGEGRVKAMCGTSNSDSIKNSGEFTVTGNIVLGSSREEKDRYPTWADNDSITNTGVLSAASIQFEKKLSTGTDVDTLVNTGILNVTGDILFGRDKDAFSTDYNFTVGGVIDGGDGEDTVTFGRTALPDFFSSGVQNGGEVRAANFKNFEFGYQDGGNWDYDGDFSTDESGNPRIDTFTLSDGTLRARDAEYPKFKKFVFEDGSIDFVKTVSADPALAVTEQFDYKGEEGTLYIDARSVASSPDLNPVWTVIEGPVVNAEGLAKNTILVTGDATRSQSEFEFTGLANADNLQNDDNKSGTVAVYPFNYAYLGTKQTSSALRANALQGQTTTDFEVRLVPTESPIGPQPDPDFCVENPNDPLCQGTIEPPELIGCEDEDLCETLPPNRDPEDSEDQQTIEIIDIITDELQEPHPELELPLIDYGQLARLLGSGLSPRNIDASGRGLQTYNNLLADTIFERLPLRQFTAVEPEPPVATPPIEEEQESVQQEPIRGLWSKTEALSDADAQQVMAQSLAQSENESSSIAKSEDSSSELLHVNGTTYIENPSLTSQYSLRDGWRAWFRGFGGNNRAYSSTTLYNDYSLNAGGVILGADVSLSDSFQIGFYGNYGNVNVNQLGDTGGGSWNPDGWGGGVTAEYWTDNFYVQGLIGASSFSGTQKRGVLSITESLGDDTASGGKNATSLLGALRVGAPFQSGGLYLEPQFTAIWTNNNEDAFTESGIDDNLRLSYGSRSTNYLETALGIKLAFPINSGEFAEWVPNLKLAWLADWDTGNGAQSIGYNFTNRRVDFESQQSNQNGALIEAGLDYTVASLDTTSWKVFAKGGAEVWGGDRGTTWRASGGVTFQF